MTGESVAAAEQRLGELPEVDSFVARSGISAKGAVDGHELYAGWHAVDPGRVGALPKSLSDRCAQWERLARTVVVVPLDEAVIAALAVGAAIRPALGRAGGSQRQALGCAAS